MKRERLPGLPDVRLWRVYEMLNDMAYDVCDRSDRTDCDMLTDLVRRIDATHPEVGRRFAVFQHIEAFD